MTFTDTLPPGGILNPDDEVVSNNGRYQLIMQRDGNLVLYDLEIGHNARWASNTQSLNINVNKCIMQMDGNLVINGSSNAIWSSNTQGRPYSFLRVQDDGNVVIYQPGLPAWATNTVQP